MAANSSGRKRWTVMAAAGVILLTQPWHGGIDPAGLAFAVAAGACWGCYILLTQHVGDRVTGLSGLAVSMPVAGVFATLVVLLVNGPSELSRVTWDALVIMLALAAIHPVLTFSLEYLYLRRLTAKAFGTLMSLEPAIALLVGLLVLGQIPNVASAIGVIFVVIAGIGAIRTGARVPAQERLRIDVPAAPRSVVDHRPEQASVLNQPADRNECHVAGCGKGLGEGEADVDQ